MRRHRCNGGGRLWISLYSKGPKISRASCLEATIRSLFKVGKEDHALEIIYVEYLLPRWRESHNPLTSNATNRRGMISIMTP